MRELNPTALKTTCPKSELWFKSDNWTLVQSPLSSMVYHSQAAWELARWFSFDKKCWEQEGNWGIIFAGKDPGVCFKGNIWPLESSDYQNHALSIRTVGLKSLEDCSLETCGLLVLEIFFEENITLD